MQIYNLITTPQYRKASKKRVTQPTFRALDIPPENELLDAIRKNKLNPSVVDKETGKTLFYILVEQNLSTAINFICAKPQLCRDVINIPYEGKTPLDIAQDMRMANMLQARNAKHYADLTDEEKGGGKYESPLTPNPSPSRGEGEITPSQKQESTKEPVKQNQEGKSGARKEDAKVAAARLNIGQVDVKPRKYANLNDTIEKKEAYRIWKEIADKCNFENGCENDIEKGIEKGCEFSAKLLIFRQQHPSEGKVLMKGVTDGAVDEDTGKTIFHTWADSNVLGAVASIVHNPNVSPEAIKKLAEIKYQGKTVLETVKEPTMYTHIHDAVRKAENEIQNTKNVDYFDAFEEVEGVGVNTGVNTEQEHALTELPQNSSTELAEVKEVPSPVQTDTLSHPIDVVGEGNSIAKQEDYEEVITTNEVIANEKKRKVTELPDSYKNYPIMELKPEDPVSIDDIIGLENIKREFKENVITPLNEQGVNVTLKANNVDIPNGILLSSVADAVSVVKATASETGMPILQVMDLETLKPMMKDIEKHYKEKGVKTIILIQGFDKFFNDQNSALAERNFRLVMNECGKKGALLIATTDDKENVCKSFKKSGLLDKILEVQKPTLEDRKTYLLQYFGDKHLFRELKNDNTINELAELMDGFNYADIDRVLDESARTAVSNSNDNVSRELALTELKEFTAERGMTPVDKNNITGQYDTVMKRVPVTEDEPKSLDDIGGMPEIKAMLRKMYVEPMKKYDLLRAELGNAAIPDGAIFYGPAGNGKTLTAKTLARELGLPYYETKLSDIATSYVHEESKAIRKLAQQLRDKYKATGEMSVWFLDEFDSLGSEREGAAQHNKELVDTLLQEFNNPSEMGYILIAATNDISNVDSALKRRGRLGNWIPFHNPILAERADVIKMTLAKTGFTKELSENQEYVNKLAKEFDGSSMSDIVNVLNDAKRMKILEDKDFDEAIKIALDINTKRQMAEFCNKAGLNAHTYGANAFQTLDELGGMEEVKKQLEENIIDVWDPEVRKIFKENKIDLPGGVILEGPPGTGKTTIIETLARQMDVPLYKMDYSKMHDSSFIHAIARNVSEIFEKLKLQSKIIKKPVMLFFDEAEKFFPRTAREKHELEEVNTYKELMNNASENGIILTGATNHIDMVNQEIVGNPRRMGTVIHVDNPDEEGRKNLFEKLRDNKPILASVLTAGVIAELVALSDGLSIGKITDTLNKLVSQSIRHKQGVNEQAVIDAFKKVIK